MSSLSKIGSYLKSLRFSHCSENHNGMRAERRSILELSSEQTPFLELSFSDEDSTTVDALKSTEDFELATQKFDLIPMLCKFLDETLKKNDLHEVLHHLKDCASVYFQAVILVRA
jgi:hypothetical protein